VRVHDLRHSFASFAVADGNSLYLIGKVLGHKQARTTEIYAHLADDPIRAVADRTAARIAAARRPARIAIPPTSCRSAPTGRDTRCAAAHREGHQSGKLTRTLPVPTAE
jgi:hypothetical protein